MQIMCPKSHYFKIKLKRKKHLTLHYYLDNFRQNFCEKPIINDTEKICLEIKKNNKINNFLL